MLNTIKKDLKLILTRKWIMIMFIAISSLLIKTSDGSPRIYKWIVLSVCISTFGLLNLNLKEDMLTHSLPVSKYDVVLGKYGLMIIIFLLCYLILSIIAKVFSVLNVIKDVSYFKSDIFMFTLLMTIVINSFIIPLMLYCGKDSRIGLVLSYILYSALLKVIDIGLSNNSEFINIVNSPMSILTILFFVIILIFISFKAYEKWQMNEVDI